MTITVAFGLMWMGIRSDYRRDYVQMDNFKTDRGARIARIGDLASGFMRTDSEGVPRHAVAARSGPPRRRHDWRQPAPLD